MNKYFFRFAAGCSLILAIMSASDAAGQSGLKNYLGDDCDPRSAVYKAGCRNAALGASIPLNISEFRLAGIGGALDEFIEIYNASNSAHVVSSPGSAGYALAASDGIARCIIPNGTSIPARGHYLCVNSFGYSLASYPAGNGTTATGDATYTLDIPINAGIALFSSSNPADFTAANRLDAVGSTTEANTIYREGGGYTSLNPMLASASDYSQVRITQGLTSIRPEDLTFPIFPFPRDTNNNAADFYQVDPHGTVLSISAERLLGAPGPENLSSPVTAIGQPVRTLLDPCAPITSSPNRVRDFTSDPPNSSFFGTVEFRRTFTNTSGDPITRLRFRVIKLTTFPAQTGDAHLNLRTAPSVVVTVDRPPCGSGTSNVTVFGTTLEVDNTAPNTGQPNNGGVNSSVDVGSVNLVTPLASGASIDLRFMFGIQGTGAYRFAIAVEALPRGGALWYLQGDTFATNPDMENIATAASVSLAGRVTNSSGAGVSKATVKLTDSNGQTRSALTNAFGYYRFDSVGVGQTVILSATSKLYQFTPQTINVTEDLTELNFTAP